MYKNGLFLGVDPGTQKHNLGLALVDMQGELVYAQEVCQLEVPVPMFIPLDKLSTHLWSLRYRFALTLGHARSSTATPILMAGIEDQWVGNNKRVGLTLSKQYGAIFSALAQFEIYSINIYPTQAKKALTGSGKADKETMVQFAQQLGMDGDNDNVADAVGVALATRVKYKEWELGEFEEK